MTAEPSRAGGSEFAALLHQRRRAAGLTQADLADLAGLAVRTVRDVERGRTARVQRTTAVLLANALGLMGEERSEFLAAARGEGAAGRGGGPGPLLVPRPRAAAARGVPLPPAPSLVGRDDELVRLARLVGEAAPATAPLTLVGMAGVGKTTLALALAHRVAGQFPGGVAGVGVDHDSDAAEVLDAVAAGFGVARPEQLPARLAGRPVLLLLDAVDRQPEGVRAALARLPPSVRVVATGRRPLGLPGEHVWPVSPLAVPPPAAPEAKLAEVARFPAAALLLDRLARVRAEPLAGEEVPALVGLVRRLGGLPLALELAAAWGRLLRLPEILERYGDRVLDLGTAGSGEVTLREAVAGSYRLLSAEERRALRRLAVFRNRWSVELAEQLLTEPPGELPVADPVPTLDRLVGLGLVGVSGARENRFRLLDVVRDFAVERAERHSELAGARRAHARVMARVAGRAAPGLAAGGMPAVVARLDDLGGDLWAALSFAANDDPATALALASHLSRWWRFRGRDVAGRRWLRRLLDDPRTAGADPLVRAWAQVGLAQLASEHGAGPEELPGLLAALAEFRRSGEVVGELAAGTVLAAVWWAQGRYDEAREMAESALLLATRAGRLREAAVAQRALFWHEVRAGDLAAARRRLAAVDRLAAQSGEQRLRALAAANLAEVARWEGRYEEAVAIGGRVLSRLGELGDPGHRREVLGTLGRAFAASGRLAEAERVLAALRAEGEAGSRSAELRGWCAAVEARLAVARGNLDLAEEWFRAAVSAFRAGRRPREVVEALVGLAAGARDPEARKRVLAELADPDRWGGFRLLPAERAVLENGF